jgi:predicted dienelactone hydrolase
MASNEFNAGCRAVDVADSVQGARIPMRLLYPTTVTERTERFGPYEIDVAMDAPMAAPSAPLILISHGGGGSSLTYRDLATYLARAGFVVALPEHPGNNRSDNSLEGTTANLKNRPRHVRLAIDAAFADSVVGSRLSSQRIALIGHSMGGYTALAVTGGKPTTGPHEPEGPGHPVPVASDPRIRALVLMAPACGWFYSEGALSAVTVPILLFTAEKDELGSHLHIDLIERGVPEPARIDHRLVPNGGHHSFQSPFPPSMTRPDFRPSQDPPGFDRPAFQPLLHAEIHAFLRSVLQ